MQLTFTSNVDRVNYTIRELIRRANMDVGRYLVRLIQKEVKAWQPIIAARGSYMPKRYQYWARKQENDLQIGVENTKFGAESAWWADQAELGTDGQPKKAFIRNTVEDHIQEIREIQAQYLSAIEDEIEAERLALEAEEAEDTAETVDE